MEMGMAADRKLFVVSWQLPLGNAPTEAEFSSEVVATEWARKLLKSGALHVGMKEFLLVKDTRF